MSPLSPVVLGLAALLASPALWNAYQGTGTTTVALSRLLVCLVIAWVSLGLLAALVGPAPRPVADADPQPGQEDPLRGTVPPGSADAGMEATPSVH